MERIIQIVNPTSTLADKNFGALVLWALCEDGAVWRLYENSRGQIWVPLRAASHSAVAALKDAASGDE